MAVRTNLHKYQILRVSLIILINVNHAHRAKYIDTSMKAEEKNAEWTSHFNWQVDRHQMIRYCVAFGKDGWNCFLQLQKLNYKMTFTICGISIYCHPPLPILCISQQPPGLQRPLLWHTVQQPLSLSISGMK